MPRATEMGIEVSLTLPPDKKALPEEMTFRQQRQLFAIAQERGVDHVIEHFDELR